MVTSYKPFSVLPGNSSMSWHRVVNWVETAIIKWVWKREVSSSQHDFCISCYRWCGGNSSVNLWQLSQFTITCRPVLRSLQHLRCLNAFTRVLSLPVYVGVSLLASSSSLRPLCPCRRTPEVPCGPSLPLREGRGFQVHTDLSFPLRDLWDERAIAPLFFHSKVSLHPGFFFLVGTKPGTGVPLIGTCSQYVVQETPDGCPS